MKVLRIDKSKIVDYLLNPENSRGKAAFFLKMGFNSSEWEVLSEAMKNQALSHPVSITAESPYGIRHSIDGEIPTPDGKFPRPRIRTVWIEENDSQEWRLITAHPI